MPKSTPSPALVQHKSPLDAPTRSSDVLLRKKKNADAQAAFRARRAAYIATLEETVTSLENVVIQLQESIRDARQESTDLKQECARLRHEHRERERFWRALYNARKPGGSLDGDELPPQLASPFPNATTPVMPYMPYRNDDPQANIYAASSPAAPLQTPQPPFASPNTPSDGSSHRAAKFAPYPYPVQGSPRDAQRWDLPQAMAPADSLSSTNPNSPSYLDSQDALYGRFEDQKVGLLESTAAYQLPDTSRSLSPTSTPGSATVPLATNFQYPFDHRIPQGADATLHGGQTDLYRVSRRHDDPPFENGQDRQAASRSRSSSPGPTPISCTVAVIKAQAFGALRRTRTRTKRSSEGAAKVAMNVLEARGIGISGQLGEDEFDMDGA